MEYVTKQMRRACLHVLFISPFLLLIAVSLGSQLPLFMSVMVAVVVLGGFDEIC